MDEIFKGMPAGFNHKAAKQVYDAIMKCDSDESAQMMQRAIVYDVMYRDIVRHQEFLDKEQENDLAKRAERYKEILAKEYVTRRLQGKPVDDLATTAEALSKALPLWYNQSAAAKKRHRNTRGQFAVEGKKLEYGTHSAPLHDSHFNQLYQTIGRTSTANNKRQMSSREKARYQEAFAQIADLVGPYKGQTGTLLLVDNRGGEQRIALNALSNDKIADLVPRAGAPRIHSAVVEVTSPNVLNPNLYHAFTAMGVGAPTALTAGNLTQAQLNSNALSPAGMKSYGDKITAPIAADRAFQPGAQLYNRLNHGGALLDDSLSPFVGPKTKAAITTAKWVGQYGPEAQRVLGPTAQKTAYRYRGTERAQPDPQLREAVIRTRRLAGTNATKDSYRRVLIDGYDDGKEDHASPVVSYFRDHVLPNTNLNDLQRMSGTIPPSQGILLDKDRKIVTQAVGYGEDWYLPFNLKKLSKLNGGEYIRTRTYGGPTTEDIYTGLLGGAEAMTVVSHNGVYTVEFDPSFKKGRRYNDKAARMVARYGQLLDAVESKNVQGARIHPARIAEIQARAIKNVGPDDPVKVKAETQRLLNREMANPQMSEQQKRDAQLEFLGNLAARTRTRDGHVMTYDQFVNQAVDTAMARRGDADRAAISREKSQARAGREAADEKLTMLMDNKPPVRATQFEHDTWTHAFTEAKQNRDFFEMMENNATAPDDTEFRENLYAQLNDPAEFIKVLGQQDRYKKFEEGKQRQLARDLSPLKLNGEGYHKALLALQEQFPYYIKDVKFRSWEDNPEYGRSDTGYVKARHIRPAKVAEGYFDPTINGHGKVHADSIAYGRIRQWNGGSSRGGNHGAASTPGGGPNNPTPGTPPVAPGSPAAAILASTALAKHIRETFTGSGAFPANAHSALANKSYESAKDWLQNPANTNNPEDRELAEIIAMSDDSIEEELSRNRTKFEQKLRNVANTISMRHYAELDPDIVASQRRGGGAPVAKDLTDPLSSIAFGNNQEFNLGPDFAGDRQHDPDDLLKVPDNDEDIQALARSTELPAIGASDFKQKMSAIKMGLLEDAKAVGGPWAGEGDKRDVEQRIKGFWKLHQLNRRHTEAVQHQARAQAHQVAVSSQAEAEPTQFINRETRVIAMPEDMLNRLREGDLSGLVEGPKAIAPDTSYEPDPAKKFAPDREPFGRDRT